MYKLLLLPAIVLLIACGDEPKGMGDGKPKATQMDTPAQAAQAFCQCNRAAHDKYLPLMDAYKPEMAKDIPEDDLPAAYREAEGLGPAYGQALEQCREQIKTFIEKVQNDKALGQQFGTELEKCMAPLIKESTPRLNNYARYMDELGQRQHNALKEKMDK